MRRLLLGGVLAVSLPLIAAAEQPLFERVGWARTGAERGGRRAWVVGAEPSRAVSPGPVVVAPAQAPSAKESPKAGAVPSAKGATASVVSESKLERSAGFKPRGWHRRAWVEGDAPPR